MFVAFDSAGFFAGTTDDTMTFGTVRCRRNPATTLCERSLVAIRIGADTRVFDANANFAYELLTSINK